MKTGVLFLLLVVSVAFADPVAPVAFTASGFPAVPAVGTNLVLQLAPLPAVPFDPLLEVVPYKAETPLWNLHRDAIRALAAGNTNLYLRLTALYWRAAEIATTRTTNKQ